MSLENTVNKGFVSKAWDKVKSAGKYAILIPAFAIGAQAADMAKPKEAGADSFANVYTQFSLANPGMDTAGGANKDLNYFLTTMGIEERDNSGNLTNTILSPLAANVYGLASDGTNLFASNTTGSIIFTYQGGVMWNAGLDISESNARGLAASATDFYLVVDNGANIARINKSTGATLNKYGITAMGEGVGLDYIPSLNQLVATNGSNQVFRLSLSNDLSSIANMEQVTSVGSGELMGIGYNLGDGKLIFNDNGTGQYATGTTPVSEAPIPPSAVLFATGLMALLANRARGRETGPK